MGIFASRPAWRGIGALPFGFQRLRNLSAARREAGQAKRNSAADGSTALSVS
jgi:hypothetical protein